MRATIAGSNISVSDDDLRDLARTNAGWRFERSDGGALLVSPTSTSGGAKSAEALVQLHRYAQTAGGKVFDAATGFKTPSGGVVSPDAAWLNAVRVREHEDDDGFWQTMPDVAVEVASKTDGWPDVTAKIDKYVADGAAYAIAIDPQTSRTYERGAAPPNLDLDVAAIIAA